MPNPSSNLRKRRSLRPALLGFIWLALALAFSLVMPEPAHAAAVHVSSALPAGVGRQL